MRPMRQILAAEPALARWLDRQQHEHAVLQQVKCALPPALAAHVEAADTGSQQLVLAATSGAAAALLRQRAPGLLQALQREGWKFTGIRVRVQPRSAGRSSGKSISKQIDAVSAAKLKARALALADPSLRHAVLRLAERAASRTSDEEQPLSGVEEQRTDQQQDRVLDDLANEPQVAAVAPEQIENRSDRDRRKRDEQ
jgi:hypothetical protein